MSRPPSTRSSSTLVFGASAILTLGALVGCPSAETATSESMPRDAGSLADAREEDGASKPSDPTSLPDFGLGARVDAARGLVTFRVRSRAAMRIALDLFAAPRGEPERQRVLLTRSSGSDVWSAEVALADIRAGGIEGAIYYGYRVWGPNWPYVPTWKSGSLDGFVVDVDDEGNRFNPNKLLYDPYALELSHDPFSPEPFDGSVYEIGSESRVKDSGLVSPKGIVIEHSAGSVGDRPTRALADDVIYEVHVRGLTMRDPDVPEAVRGTYRGAALKAKYLRALGVSAIELLPIHETQNEQNDATPTRQNYWGYASNSFFAPDRRFAADKSPGGPTRELRAMVEAFHAEGIKVFVDVVYNHTGEGGSNHLISWRGFDARGYYEPGEGLAFADNNGVGPNFHPRSPEARQLVIDSLRYYAHYLGVDGFRFDLASVLGDGCESYCFVFDKLNPKNALNRAVKELPARPTNGGAGVDLIAEPWAIGLGTYQVGGFPHGWSEWNDGFRDTIRRAQNRVGVADVTPRHIAEHLLGSRGLFEDDGRSPSASVNFVTAHDGFTLRDLYSYDAKQNEQSPPFGPSTGGTDDNLSWSHGGDASEQQRAARTAMLLLATSTGVPMLLGGDELYRTQRGNNNAYNLDNAAMWLDWSALTTQASFHRFVAGVLALRAAHPALRPQGYREEIDHDGNGLRDVTILEPSGAEASAAFLDDPTRRFVALRFDGEEAGDEARSILVAYNWSAAPITLTLPARAAGSSWLLAAHSELGSVAKIGDEPVVATQTTQLSPRSAIVLLER